MNIVVCMKQVPDTDNVKIDPETNTLVRKGVESIINPYDLHAIEAALMLKEEYGGSVTVVSMGPSQVEKSLKEAISLGVDDVILLSDRAFAGADTLATSYTLAKGIKKIANLNSGVDLILCGKQAIDGDTAQVGPGIAENLGIPHVTNVEDIMETGKKEMIVKRNIEDGCETIKVKLPALYTVLKELNEPRFPSIRGILRSIKMDGIKTWTVDDLNIDTEFIGLKGSPTQVVNISTPQIDVEGEIFEGSADEQAEKLLRALCEKEIL